MRRKVQRKVIMPTGTCFTDGIETMHGLIEQEGRDSERHFVLVHAICISVTEQLYSHCWLEDTLHDVAIFQGFEDGERKHFAVPLAEYRESHRIQDETRYTWQEAYALNHMHNNFGPWESKYLDLCRPAGQEQLIFGLEG